VGIRVYVVVVRGVLGLCTPCWGKLGGERVEVVEDKGPKPNIRVTSRKVALKRDMATAMTNRVLCNGVTVSDIKSMNGLAVNTLPDSLYPRWH